MKTELDSSIMDEIGQLKLHQKGQIYKENNLFINSGSISITDI